MMGGMMQGTGEALWCLSLDQPYAELVRLEAKTIETRWKKTGVRGRFAIASTQRINTNAVIELENAGVLPKVAVPDYKRFPLGVLRCTVELVDVRKLTEADEKPACCKCAGKWGYMLERPEKLFAIKVRGMPGFFKIGSSMIEIGRAWAAKS